MERQLTNEEIKQTICDKPKRCMDHERPTHNNNNHFEKKAVKNSLLLIVTLLAQKISMPHIDYSVVIVVVTTIS